MEALARMGVDRCAGMKAEAVHGIAEMTLGQRDLFLISKAASNSPHMLSGVRAEGDPALE